MLFGAAMGTVLGKSLGGYVDGQRDTFDREPRPMVRFLLDEPTRDGDGYLTLEVTQTQYAQLLPGQSGKLSWWGQKLSDFVPAEGAGETSAPGVELRKEPMEPLISEPEAENKPPPKEEVQQPAEEAAAIPLVRPRPSRYDRDCPWCGKSMGIWRMNSPQYGAVLKRGEQWKFDKEKFKRLLFTDDLGEKDRIELECGSFDMLLFYVCEECKKAVINL